jgi:hypothetical protein
MEGDATKDQAMIDARKEGEETLGLPKRIEKATKKIKR